MSQTPAGLRTPLYDLHVEAGARMVPFAGWEMPLHYGSALGEHHAVRRAWGIFDVSHMTVIDVVGPGATAFLGRLLANDINKLGESGRGLYSCMLDMQGGVIDDLIAYRTADQGYRLVVNAATRDKDLAWVSAMAGDDDVTVAPLAGAAMIAIQGPEALMRAATYLPDDVGGKALALAPFSCVAANQVFVARTGYTGEDGWEVILPAHAGRALWQGLSAAGAARCGLAARDTLRLEAALNLYGQDMDADTSPLVAGLGWTVAFDPPTRAFIGREALEAQRAAGVPWQFVGLLLEERGIMRHGQAVRTDAGDGVITSGGYSPTMDRSIALARVPVAAGDACEVAIRNDWRRARIVRPPFVRHGRVLVDLG